MIQTIINRPQVGGGMTKDGFQPPNPPNGGGRGFIGSGDEPQRPIKRFMYIRKDDESSKLVSDNSEEQKVRLLQKTGDSQNPLLFEGIEKKGSSEPEAPTETPNPEIISEEASASETPPVYFNTGSSSSQVGNCNSLRTISLPNSTNDGEPTGLFQLQETIEDAGAPCPQTEAEESTLVDRVFKVIDTAVDSLLRVLPEAEASEHNLQEQIQIPLEFVFVGFGLCSILVVYFVVKNKKG